ncbi:MAG: hypothetical protein ACLFUH_08020 [Bacteroidales bacterium]
MNYEQDISIDESALDVEWLEQPDLMRKYTRYQADCKHELDLAQERLDLVRADLDRKIRRFPEDYDINVKLTEAVVSNTIIQNEEYKEAYHEYLEVKYEYEVAKGAVTAIEHRKNSLENLVKLLNLGYFAGPKMPRDLSAEIQQKEESKKRVSNKVGKRLKRKK